MIPARDPEEFALFPAEDTKFIHDWLAWTDANLDAVRNTVPIASLSSPGVGKVDGTSAMTDENDGFLFLFNPGFQPIAANITVDEDIGLSNASAGLRWDVVELYPSPDAPIVGTWRHGDATQVMVGGSGARVLQLKKTTAPTGTARLVLKGLPGDAAVSLATGAIVLSGVSGAAGRAFAISVEAPPAEVRGAHGAVVRVPSAVEINGQQVCAGVCAVAVGAVTPLHDVSGYCDLCGCDRDRVLTGYPPPPPPSAPASRSTRQPASCTATSTLCWTIHCGFGSSMPPPCAPCDVLSVSPITAFGSQKKQKWC